MTCLRVFELGIGGILITTEVSASTLTVDLNGDADYTDIQADIDAAADDATLYFLSSAVRRRPSARSAC